MKNLFVMTLTTLFAATAFAGASNASFECVSASGRTTLSASVPGDYAEHSVTLKIDGKKVKYIDANVPAPSNKNIKNSEIEVLGTMKDKNYSFAITEVGNPSAALLTLTAIPKSINVKDLSIGERGSLRAIIQGIDPRGDGTVVTKPIEVKCKYDYTI
jgi:hypothetical protein